MTPAQKIKNSIKKLLALHGWYCFGIGSTASRNKDGGFYMTGTPGAPDLIAVRNNRVLLIEVKAGSDKLRPSQIKFKQQCEHAGTTYHVVKSASDLMDDRELNRQLNTL